MTLSMYQASVPVFLHMLGNLKEILQKGESFAQAKKIDGAVLLNSRLAPDMFPLSKQVQIACDSAKLATARLSGVEAPKNEDIESSFAELYGRIDSTVAYLNSVGADKVDGTEGKDISFKAGPTQRDMKGQAYLFNHAIPNHFFHISTAYAILRHNGVELGKRDFLGI